MSTDKINICNLENNWSFPLAPFQVLIYCKLWTDICVGKEGFFWAIIFCRFVYNAALTREGVCEWVSPEYSCWSKRSMHLTHNPRNICKTTQSILSIKRTATEKDNDIYKKLSTMLFWVLHSHLRLNVLMQYQMNAQPSRTVLSLCSISRSD